MSVVLTDEEFIRIYRAAPTPTIPHGEGSWESLVKHWEVGIFHGEAKYWGVFDSPDVTGLGVIADEDSRMMDGAIYGYPFLDGGLVLVEKESPEDWDDDALDDGIWIVGNAALRLICDTLGMDQPPRLPGEVDVPDIALIHRASEARRIVCPDARSQADALQWWSEIRALVANTPDDWIAHTGQPD